MAPSPLLHQLRVLARQLWLAALARGLAHWVMVASALLLLLTAAAHWGASAYVLPLCLLLAAGALVGCLLPPAWRRLSPRQVATLVESQHGHLRERLLTAADLAERGPGLHSPQLAAVVVEEAARLLPTLPRDPVLQGGRLRWRALLASLCLVVALTMATVGRQDLARLLTPTAALPAPARAKAPAPPPPAPLLSGVRISLQPPAYTGLPTRVLTADLGRLRALPGTRVTLGLRPPVGAAPTLALNRQPVPLRPADDHLQHAFTLRAPTRWVLAVRNAHGGDERSGEILLQTDRPPTVRLLQPRREVSLRELGPVTVAAVAADDYGLTRLALQWRLGDRGAWQTEALGAGDKRAEVSYDWDLTPLNLRPGQTVTLRFLARDNDTVSGPHVATSRTVRLTLADPRPQRARERLQAMQQDQGEALERLRQEAREIQEELQDLRERLESGEMRTTDASTRAALEQAADRLQRQADKLRQTVAEAQEELQKRGPLPPEAAERLRQLNDMLRQTLEKQLPHAVAQLREAARNVAPRQMPRQVQQAQDAQQELLQQLEQLAALLKQAQLENSLANLRAEVQELLQRQQDLSARRQQTAPHDRGQLATQAEKQQALARDTRPLPEKLGQVAQQSATAAPELQQRLRDLAQQTRQQDPAGKMQQAAGELDRGQPQQAAVSQSQAQQALQQLAAQLAGAQAEVYRQQRQELQQAARELTREALSLSRQQESVRRDTGQLRGQSQNQVVQAKPRLQQLTQRQETVTQGLEKLGEKLQRLSHKSPLMDPGLGLQAQRLQQRSAQAGREVAGGVPEQATATQGEVMAGINRLAQQLLGAQGEMQQASAQKAWQEMMKRLEQMAQQQQALNQQSGAPGQGVPQPAPGQGQPGLADAQARLRQALQQMLGEAGAGSGLGQQLGGVPAQMDDVEEALRGGQVTRQTQRTQADILHKLLDAQRALYRKDRQDRQRRAETPRPYQRPSSPPELRQPTRRPSPAQTTPPPLRDLPLGYEDLTRQYFEALGRR